MGSTVFYDNVNELATITVTFTVANVPTDPSTISCVVTDPAGAQVVHTFGGAAPADITRTGTGVYQLNVACTPSVTGIEGLWSYAFIGTGTASDVQPGTWRVWALDMTRWYVGPEELKDRLGIGDITDDTIINAVCNSTSRWIDRYCGRHFFRFTDTRTYQPGDITLLPVDDVVSVTSFKIDMDGDGVYETTWTSGVNYRLKVGEGQYNTLYPGEPVPYTQVQTVGGSIFPFIYPFSFLDRVQITGVFGWPQVPTTINQAALLVAADWFKMKDAPWGVAGISDLGIVRVSANPWVVEQLRPYIRGRGKVGV